MCEVFNKSGNFAVLNRCAPPPNPLDAQVTAIKDSFNQGISENKKGSQPLFINYTIIIEYEQYVCEAAASLILSAKNIIFRTPPP